MLELEAQVARFQSVSPPQQDILHHNALSPFPGIPGSDRPFVAFDKHGIAVHFDFFRIENMPQLTLINARTNSRLPDPIKNFSLFVAVPAFIKLRVGHPSSYELIQGMAVTQRIKIMNTLHGQKPLLLKVMICGSVHGTPFEEVTGPLKIPI